MLVPQDTEKSEFIRASGGMAEDEVTLKLKRKAHELGIELRDNI